MIVTLYTTKEDYNPCGTDYAQIYHEGKTSRIAENHIKTKKSFLVSGYEIVKAKIYRVNPSDFYNDEKWKLIKTIYIS